MLHGDAGRFAGDVTGVEYDETPARAEGGTPTSSEPRRPIRRRDRQAAQRADGEVVVDDDHDLASVDTEVLVVVEHPRRQ